MKSKVLAAVVIICVFAISILATVLILFKNPIIRDSINSSSDTDLSEYFDDVHVSTSPVILSQYTDSTYVDSAIDSLKLSNSFTTVAVIETWYDNMLNMNCYYVLFDDSVLYCLTVGSDNKVYIDLRDYEYYLSVE